MKKTVGQIKNGLPGAGQDKDTVTAVQRVSIKHATKFQQQWQSLRENSFWALSYTSSLKTWQYLWLFYRVCSQKAVGSNLGQYGILIKSPGTCSDTLEFTGSGEDKLVLTLVCMLQPWWRRRFETSAPQTLICTQERGAMWISTHVKISQWAAPAPRRNGEKPPGSFSSSFPNIRATAHPRAPSHPLTCTLARGSTAALQPEGCWQWQCQWPVRFREAACVALSLHPLYPASPQPPGWGHQHSRLSSRFPWTPWSRWRRWWWWRWRGRET